MISIVTSMLIRNVIFLLLAAIFVMLVATITRLIEPPNTVLFILGAVFGLLGIAMVILTAKLDEAGIRKRFLILTGASAAAIPLSAILHNLVYALFIAWFGKDFWGADGDEPVFFILALFVFPAMFMVGWVISAALYMKEKRVRVEPQFFGK